MKILIGVCGFGNGHCFRQSCVLNQLRQRGHEVALFTHDRSGSFFQTYYQEVPQFIVRVPWISASHIGLDFGRIAGDSRNTFGDGYSINFSAMDKVLNLFHGPPDLVISDYDPISAQFGYATCRPVITIDNQSKFLGFQFPPLNGLTRNEDRCRLSFFFPQALARFAVSFFQVSWPPDPQFPVTVIPPLVRRAVLDLAPAKQSNNGATHIAVYLSPYGPIDQPLPELGDALRRCATARFSIYSQNAVAESGGNVRFRGFDTQGFAEELRDATAVICTAGHNLLSELMYLQKPVLALPFDTFEQSCNAAVISERGFGMTCKRLSTDIIKDFVGNVEVFRSNIERAHSDRSLPSAREGHSTLLSLLHENFGV
jgi:uncharacterized protein (TIGR00661 family)